MWSYDTMICKGLRPQIKVHAKGIWEKGSEENSEERIIKMFLFPTERITMFHYGLVDT